MRKKVIWSCLLWALILMPISACGGKYDGAVKINDKFVDAVEGYISDMEKAGDAGAVAAAVNDFAAVIEKIAPEMKKIAEKYPELKDPAKIPAELKDSQARAEAVSSKMAGQMMKAVTYMRDPDVQEAQTRLQKAMMTLGK